MGSLKKLFLFMLFVIPAMVLAQDVVVPPTPEEWQTLLASLGGVKGAGTLGVVAFAVQALMYLFRSELGKFAGKYRLVLVLVLTLGGGVLALKMQGISWVAAVLHSSTLSSFQVLLHQVMKQFFTPKGEAQ